MAGKSPKWGEDEVVLTPPRGMEVQAALEELDRLNPCLIFEQSFTHEEGAQVLEGPVQECFEVCFGGSDCAG